MYKLWHYLFGWDYVYYNYGGSGSIAKVRRLPDNRLYYKRCGNIVIITNPLHVTWLTCRLEKYFKEKQND